MRNLTIKMRLIVTLGIVGALLVAVGVLGIMGMREANKGLETVYNDRTVPLMDLGLMIDMANRIRTNAVLAANVGKTDVAEKMTTATREIDTEIDKLWAKYMATYLTPEEKKLAETFVERWKLYKESRDHTLKLGVRGDFAGSKENALKDAGPKFTQARETLFKLIEMQGAVAKQEFENSEHMYALVRNITLAATLIGLALAGFMGWLLIRAITVPLEAAVALAGRIARGELDNNIQVTSNDELGKLMTALKEMSDKLVAIVTDVRGGSGADRHRLQADRRGQHQPLPAHPGTGQRARRDGLVDGRDDEHGETERRQRPPGQPAGRQHPHPGAGRRRGGDQGGRRHGRDQRPPPRRSPTSSASSTKSPSRPTCWR